MKKKVLFSIALVLLLFLSISSALAAQNGIFDYLNVQIIDHTVYFMDSSSIFAHRGADVFGILEKDDYPEVHWLNAKLATDGEKLYIIDPDNFEVYRLEEDGVKHVVSLRPPVDGWMTQFVIQGNGLYVLMRDKETLVDYRLYRYALDTGRYERIRVEDCNFWEIALGADGQLIGWDNHGKRVVTFDGISGKVIASTPKLPSWNVGGLCYDKENAAVCFLMNNELIRWDGKNMTVSDYLVLESCISIYDTGFNQEGFFMALDRNGYHYDNYGKSLTILADPNDDFIFQQIMYGFMRAYPDINVRLRYRTDGVTDAECDLILRSSQDAVATDIIPKLELDSSLLRADVENMYWQIQKYVTKNDTLYAYPIEIWTTPDSAHMTYAYITPSSKQRCEAIRFLEYYTRHLEDAQRALRYRDCINDFPTLDEAKAYDALLDRTDATFFKTIE